MFMKVYQYPPRRGNGSYWTLLSDGEEELKKAVPLFATLQPPVIDSNCAYHREPSTHTVKSKGKFVPVLPRSDLSSAGGLPYFSIGPTQLTSGVRMTSAPNMGAASEVVIGESSCGMEASLGDDEEFDCRGSGEGPTCLGKRPRHLSDHSYAKAWQLRGTGDEVMEGKSEPEILELAAGGHSGWDSTAEGFSDPSTPKRRRKISGTCHAKPAESLTDLAGDDITTRPKVVVSSPGGSPSVTTPPNEDQDSSLHLLDSSFLTPLKNMAVPDLEIGAISFSPLYANLITPKLDKTSKFANSSTSSDTPAHHHHHHAYFSSPLTPLKTSLDSGIFSPLRSDGFGGMKFSTPNSLSPLADLSSFSSSLQPELYPFKVLNSSGSASSTPLRPGSLHALGLPGLTPPSRK